MKKLLLLCALMLGSTSAAAQDTDSQLINNIENGAAPIDADSWQQFNEFVTCAAADQMPTPRKLLRWLPTSDSSDKILFWIGTLANSCSTNGTRLRYSVRYMRGPIAEYLLKRDFDLKTWRPKDKPAKVYTTPSNGKLKRLSADTRSAVIFTEIASCVVKSSPETAATLFTSTPNTPEEKTAFASLSPLLAGCIPPSVELRMSKYQLRGYLAEAAYRYAASVDQNEAKL